MTAPSQDDTSWSGDPTTPHQRAPQEFGFDRADEPWLDEIRRATRHSAPSQIGDYKIEGEISRGGQGVVYRGIHVSTNRTVALKYLHAGALAGREARARFEREVQLASSLRHPGIVIVHGVEHLDDQPVIAMEWIDGAPITHWARPRNERRSIAEILDVAIRICDAVHHAHQRGVLHRDLKPSNVLVDTDGQPKIVDFGVAIELHADHGTKLTASGDFVGTLAYAAPEQLSQLTHGPDVRTDIWAIGLILYEILTGRRPFDSGGSIAEAVRAIERGQLAGRPSAFAPDVGFELDTIVLKALANDPAARYQSADAMREDLRRLQQDLPILAHPPSTWYQLRKLVARNRKPFLWSGLAATLLIGLTIVSLVQADTISTTQQSEAQARKGASNVTAYIHELFRELGPTVSGEPASIQKMIERATRRIDKHFAVDSILRADLRDTIGVMLIDLGSYDPAVAVLRDALEVREQLGGMNSVDEARSRIRLGDALLRCGEYVEAEALFQVALRLYRSTREGSDSAEDPQHSDQITALLLRLADVDQARGRESQTVERLEEVLARQPPENLESGLGRASTLLILADVQDLRGDYLASQTSASEALTIRRAAFGDQHPAVAEALIAVASAAESRGDLNAADEHLQSALAMREQRFGPQHPKTAQVFTEIGELRAIQGRLEDALDYFIRAQDVFMQVRDGANVGLAAALQGRAAVLVQISNVADAEQMMRDSLATMREQLSEPHPGIAATMSNLASILAMRGAMKIDRQQQPEINDELAEARELLLAAHEMYEHQVGPRHLELANTVNGLGAISSYLGEWDAAERHYRSSLELLQTAGLESHPQIVTLLTNLAAVERDRARARARTEGQPKADLAAAIDRVHRAREAAEQQGMAESHPDRQFLLQQLTVILYEAGRYDEYRTTLEVIADADSIDQADGRGFVDNAHLRLINVLLSGNELDAAEQRLRTLHDKLIRHEDASHYPESVTFDRWARLHRLRGEPDKAAWWMAKLAPAETPTDHK